MLRIRNTISFMILQAFFLSIFTLLFAPSSVYAAPGINRTINFQGKVVNKADGINIPNGNYTFEFKLYDDPTAGNQLPVGTPWTESQSLPVTDGIFRATLGSSTPIPAGVDFNSDTIYLSISFNGELFGSRIRFTAVPYAFNAEKVGGLTVTNTTGTLTIPNATTVTFSGANNVTFTTTNTTIATLPEGTITLADLSSNQTFINKTIGSTGLVFNGATTDITTVSNENFSIVPNGTGKVGIGTTAPAAMLDINGNLNVSTYATVGASLAVGYSNALAGPGNAIFSGKVGVGTTTPTARLQVVDASSKAVSGSELITDSANDGSFDSDLSHWTGSNWSIGSGVATHTAGAADTYTLSNTYLNSAPVAGKYYEIIFRINTTTAGTLTMSFGGANGVQVGKTVDNHWETQVVKAVNTNPLTFTPNAAWAGTLDDIMVSEVEPTTPAFSLVGSDGSVSPVEFRPGGSGDQNVFIGADSGMLQYSGGYNTTLGYQAMANSTNGYENVAIGTQALFSLTDGGINLAIGPNAGYNITSGDNNLLIGENAGYEMVNGIENVAIGVQAGDSIVSGEYNTFLGHYVGGGASSSNNTYIGHAVANSSNSGSNNTVMGYMAGRNIAGDSNIFVGYQAGYNEAGSNKLYIENSNSATPLIWGDFATNVVNFNGSVGIGTTAPAAQLDVLGSATASGNITMGGQLQVGRFGTDPVSLGNGAITYNSTTNKFRCFQAGAWTDCIGTGGPGSSVWSDLTAPTAALNMNMYQSVGTSFATTFTYGNATSTNNLFNLTDTASNTGTGYLLNLTTASSSTLNPLHVSSSGVEALFVNANGSVGIGTTLPTAKLDVSGTASVSAFTIRGSSPGYINQINGNDFIIRTSVGGDAGLTERLTINNGTGNVGIGTTAAGDRLDVVGEIDSSTFYKLANLKILDVENTETLLVGQGAGASLVAGADYNTFIGQSAGNNANNISADNNTGVGYRALLNVNSGSANTAIGRDAGSSITTGINNTFLGAYADANANGYNGSIALGAYATVTASNQLVLGGSATNANITDAYFGEGVFSATPGDITFNATGGEGDDIIGANFIFAGGKGTGAGDGGDLIFKTADALTTGNTLQSLTEKMRITDEGNVGIGVTAPTARLSIAAATAAVASANIASASAAPSSPIDGDVYYDSTKDSLMVYTGSKWQADRSSVTLVVAANDSQNKEKADYVADGTNDQVEIEAAIAALPAGGGSVVLLDGTFSIGADVTVNKSNVTLTGQGKSTILRRAFDEGVANTSGVITVSDNTTTISGITIANLKIDGLKATYTSAENNGIFLRRVTDSKLSNLYVESGGGVGMLFYNTAVAYTGMTINGNYIASNTGRGIAFTHVSGSLQKSYITNNTVKSNTGEGIYLYYGANYNTISNNITDANAIGIYLQQGNEYNSITDNVVINSTGNGILVATSTNGNNITGNTVKSNAGIGIRLYTTTHDTVADNLVYASGSIGIDLYATTYAKVSGNQIVDSTDEGILIRTGSNYNTIEGNFINNSAGSGSGSSIRLYWTSDYNIVRNNTIIDSAGSGYAINVSNATGGATGTILANNNYSGTGASSILDTGTGTVYQGQSNGATGADIVFNNSGNFGIGNIAPTAKLDVTGTASVSGNLTIGNGSAIQSAYGSLNFNYKSGLNTWATGMVLDDITGFVGIGNTSPTANLDVVSSQTTGNGMNLTANSLTSGNGFYLSSTATALTGNMMSLFLNPASASTITGDMLHLDSGSNLTLSGYYLNILNNGSPVFQVGQNQIVNSVPTSFTSAGDVSMSYDLIFTNSSQAYVNFEGPGYIRTNHPSGNYDLTLTAANYGIVLVDDFFKVTGDATVSGQLAVGYGATLPTSTSKLDVLGSATASGNITMGGQLRVGTFGGDTEGLGNGSIIYNGATNKFRCFQAGAWTDCIGTGGPGSSVWSDLTAPTAALNMNMYQSVGTSFATTFTYGNATSTNNLFNLTDTASNTGTGYLFNLTTASSSTLNPLHVSAAGVESILVNASGNVGIGNTSPTAKLDVTGAASVSGNLTVGNGSAIQSAYGPLTFNYKSNQNAWTAGLTLQDSTGNVGIGIPDSTAKLAIGGDVYMSGIDPTFTMYESDTAHTWRYRITGDQFLLQRDSVDAFVFNNSFNWILKGDVYNNQDATFKVGATAADSQLVFQTSNTDKMYITSGGDVGIGVSLPTAKLDVLGSATASGNITMGGQLRVGTFGGDTAGLGNGSIIYNGATNKFRCFQNGAWTDCIGTGGPGSSVWSDLTAPTAALNMNMYQSVGTSFATTFTYGNATSTTNLFNLTDTASNTGTGYLLNLTTASSSTLKPIHVSAAGTEALMVNASGNVGIGNTAPTAKLDVTGTASVSGNLTVGNGSAIQSAYGSLNFNYKSGLNTWAIGMVLDDITGFVGIGNTTPTANLDVVSAQTTGNGMNLTVDSLTSGNGFYLSSAATALTGNMMSLFLNPGSASTITGDILHINSGSNLSLAGYYLNILNNGSAVFQVGQNQIISSVPHSFTAAGDVSLAYDLIFTNAGGSYLKSDASFNLEAGATWGSNNLTLKTYNAGNIVADTTLLSALVNFNVNGAATVSGSLAVGYPNGRSNNLYKLDVAGWASTSGNLTTGGQFQLGRFSNAPAQLGIGSLYYNTTDNKVYYYNNSAWTEMGAGSSSPSGPSVFQELLGVIRPMNNTTDFLFGGTATTSAKFAFLNVNSGTPMLRLDSDSDNTNKGCFRFNGATNEMQYSNDCSAFQSFASSTGGGWTDDGLVMRTTTNTDKVGIGTSAPDGLFQVDGKVTGKALAILNETGDQAIFTASASGTTRFVINNNGNVGIGTTAPTSKLDVAGGVTIGAQADATAHNFDAGCNCQLNSAPGTFGSETNRDGVASPSGSLVWRGKLFVSTQEENAAGVYRYDGGTTWTLVTYTTLGEAASDGSDSTNIDSFAMVVYNDALYIGSRTGPAGNTAALYVSTSADTTANSFSIVTSRGVFAGRTTNVDGISDLAVWHNKLYIGTQEPNLAEVDRWDGGTTLVQVSNTTEGRIGAVASTTTDEVKFAVHNGRLYAANITGPGGNAARVSVYTGTATSWVDLNTTAGAFGGETGIDDVTGIVSWNGALYVATQEVNQANIYKWELNDYAVTQVVADFKKVNNATGKVISGDTANIDSIVLGTYNGRLYAGTTNVTDGTGALYEFSNNNNWSLINTTRGDFNGNTGTDGVSMIQEYNGQLYVGTTDVNGAAVYTWSKTLENSYTLRFDSGNQNYGAISFVGLNGINSNGSGAVSSGAFNFTNSISMSSGAFDYAEDYPTLDNSLVAGEMVSVDPEHPEHVRKAQPKDSVLGIISTNPGFRISSSASPASGARWIPIALVGRVPVKVSTESGAIAIGDNIAMSSIPGVGMKSTKAGNIIGQALTAYDGEGVDTVTVFIKNTGTNGSFANADDARLNAREILDRLATDPSLAIDTSAEAILSEIFTDRLIAGLEVVTPKVVADSLVADMLSAKNASISGTLTADTIRVNHLEGLDMLFGTNNSTVQNELIASMEASLARVDSLSGKVVLLENLFYNASPSAYMAAVTPISADGLKFDKKVVAMDGLTVLGKTNLDSLFVSGDMQIGLFAINGLDSTVSATGGASLNAVVGKLQFKAQEGLEFVSSATFKDTAKFEKGIAVNEDSAGYALIKTGSDSARIEFTQEYKEIPVIQVNKVSLKGDKPKANVLGAQTVQFEVEDIDETGFVIRLSDPAASDLRFSWTAIQTIPKKISLDSLR